MPNNHQDDQPTLWDEVPEPTPPRRSAPPASRTSTKRSAPTRTALFGTALWSIDELSTYLGVPVQTIYGWRQSNYGPPALRVGKHLRWRPETVDAWVRERES